MIQTAYSLTVLAHILVTSAIYSPTSIYILLFAGGAYVAADCQCGNGYVCVFTPEGKVAGMKMVFKVRIGDVWAGVGGWVGGCIIFDRLFDRPG